MAVSKKTAEAAKSTIKQDVAGRRAKTKGEPQFANYAEKAVPERIQEFAEYLTRETGYEVDLRSVYLGSALRGTFQKSAENQERIAARAAEIEQEKIDRLNAREERAKAKVEREAARAAKAAEAKAAPAKKATPAKAPAKSTSKTTAQRKAGVPASKAAPAKTTTRRRPAKPAAEDADF